MDTQQSTNNQQCEREQRIVDALAVARKVRKAKGISEVSSKPDFGKMEELYFERHDSSSCG